ncbi:MAG: hypothetical protein WKF67_04115 [Rubrobacteraceae bacterium]
MPPLIDVIKRTVLERADAGFEGARKIGAGLSGITGTNVQVLLEALKTLVDGKASSSHPHSGADITSGTVLVARVGTGTKDTTTFYRGDGIFAVPPGGGGGANPFSDATALVKDDVDATKLLRIDVGSVATATTRALTMPNADVNLTADQAVGTPSMRTLGTGAQQALPGNHSSTTIDAAATVGSLRTLGTGALQGTPGNDARLSAYYKFFRSGSTASPITGVGWEPVVEARTLNSLHAVFNTAPTVVTTISLKRRTSGGTVAEIATISVTANAFQASTTDLTVALAAGDSLRVDVTAGGTTGSDVTVVGKAI